MTNYDHAKLNLRLGNLQAARDDAEKALSIPDRNGLDLDLQVYTLLAQIYGRLGTRRRWQSTRPLPRARIPPRSNDRKCLSGGGRSLDAQRVCVFARTAGRHFDY